MPRVTEQHRQARRDEIADAAVRLVQREGRGAASISRIVEESGLSTGAIYANFENKSALARYVVERLTDWRAGALEAAFAPDGIHPPATVLAALLDDLEDHAPPAAVVLQYWAEAVADADLQAVLEAKLHELREAIERVIRGWAEESTGGRGEVLARESAAAVVALHQGFLTQSALLGSVDTAAYIRSVGALFAPVRPPSGAADGALDSRRPGA